MLPANVTGLRFGANERIIKRTDSIDCTYFLCISVYVLIKKVQLDEVTINNMDPLTHALMGAALGGFASQQALPAAYWAAVAAAVAPDGDVIVHWLKGRNAFLKTHRGPSHSLPGLLALAAGITLIAHLIWPAAPWWTVFCWAMVGGISHVFFDVFNAYGTQVLWPWRRDRLAWDVLQLVEWPLLLVLGGALTAAALWPEQRGLALATGWALVGLYVLWRVRVHNACLRLLRSHFGHLQPEQISCIPHVASLRLFRYVVKAGNHFHSGFVTSNPAFVTEMRTTEVQDHDVIEASKQCPTVEALLAMARHPWATFRRFGSHYLVEWSDLRYEVNPGQSQYRVQVWLDENLGLLDERPPLFAAARKAH